MSVMRSLKREYQKARGEFKGKPKLRGHHNYTLKKKADLGPATSIMATLFNQLFGNALRGAK